MLKGLFGVVVAAFVLATGSALASVNVIDYVPAADQTLCQTTGIPHTDAAVSAALTAAHLTDPAGTDVVFAACKWNWDAPYTITVRDRWEGSGSGGLTAGPGATRFYWPANTSGLLLQAAGAQLDNLYLHGSGTSGDGITMNFRAIVSSVGVSGFGHDCVSIVSGAGQNVNGWSLQNVNVDTCGNDGFYVAGTNANAGLAQGITVKNVGNVGIDDESFLGNTYVAPEVAGATVLAYKTGSNNAKTVFIGAYQEDGQTSSLIAPTLVLGGYLETATQTGSAQKIGAGSLSPFSVVRVNAVRNLTLYTAPYDDEFVQFQAAGDNTRGWSFYWSETAKTYQWRFARLDAAVVEQFTSDLFTGTDEAGVAMKGGKMILNSVWAQVSGGKYRNINFLTQNNQVAASAAAITTLQAQVAALTARLAAAHIP